MNRLLDGQVLEKYTGRTKRLRIDGQIERHGSRLSKKEGEILSHQPILHKQIIKTNDNLFVV